MQEGKFWILKIVDKMSDYQKVKALSEGQSVNHEVWWREP